MDTTQTTPTMPTETPATAVYFYRAHDADPIGMNAVPRDPATERSLVERAVAHLVATDPTIVDRVRTSRWYACDWDRSMAWPVGTAAALMRMPLSSDEQRIVGHQTVTIRHHDDGTHTVFSPSGWRVGTYKTTRGVDNAVARVCA
jgi:hypothetical protein